MKTVAITIASQGMKIQALARAQQVDFVTFIADKDCTLHFGNPKVFGAAQPDLLLKANIPATLPVRGKGKTAYEVLVDGKRVTLMGTGDPPPTPVP